MASTMSKFLHQGMDLPEVVRLATARPAEILGMRDRIGTLGPGADADITVLRLEEGEFPLPDSQGQTELVTVRLAPEVTIRAGSVMWSRDSATR